MVLGALPPPTKMWVELTIVEQTRVIGFGRVGPGLMVQVRVLAIADRDSEVLPPISQKEVSSSFRKLFWARFVTEESDEM